MEARLSIIIPVYKVEQTLDRCVQSVLRSCSDAPVQIILVDDGSPDACPSMCDEWAKRDARIEVLHRRNGGLSAARNAGLERACCEWITFVDSDDEVHWEDVDEVKLFRSIVDDHKLVVDVIEFPVMRHCGTAQECLVQWGDRVYTSPVDYWLQTKGWEHAYAWNKLFRRTLFKSVRFPEKRVFEDVWTTPLLLKQARAIRTIPAGCYRYYHNPEGITHTAGAMQLIDLLQGSIQSMRLFYVCDVRQYASLLDRQIDIYKQCHRVLLHGWHFSWREIRTLQAKQRFKMSLVKLLGMRTALRLL